MITKLEIAIAAMQGMLASETDEFGQCDQYIHPQTKVKCYGPRPVPAVKDDGSIDYNSSVIPILVKTRVECIAHEAFDIAEAMLNEERKRQ